MSESAPFAGVVARAMRERGVTLRALCREVGLDASFFSKVLAGKRSPPVEEDVLRRIAAALGLEPAELVVAAGRIPAEWRGLWGDSALFAAMHSLAAGAPPAAKARPAPAKREPAPVPVFKPKVHFGDELL